jgi:hypothetical protein
MTNISTPFSKFDNLRFAENRLVSLKMYSPESSETKRHNFIVKDLQSKLTATELSEYYDNKNLVLTAADREKERIAMIKQMNENRDKQSI